MPPSHPGAPAARSLLASGATLSLRKTVPPPWTQRPSFSRALSSEERAEMLEDNRKRMFQWLAEKGENYRRPIGRPNYAGGADNQPFPQNAAFRSQRVLSQDAKEKIWTRVVVDGQPLKAVSAELGVDVRRVAAVVRLQEVEKRWIDEGKKLALPYARAVMQMLPQNDLEPNGNGQLVPHESIGDIHVHSWTSQQVFWPTSESRHFTREDAAKAFHERMLPADKRVAHRELIEYERDLANGVEKETAWRDFVEAAGETEKRAASIQEKKVLKTERETSRVMTERFEFRFRDINIDDVGPTGRSRKGTGVRYGVPFYDRRRGEVKIPTKAE